MPEFPAPPEPASSVPEFRGPAEAKVNASPAPEFRAPSEPKGRPSPEFRAPSETKARPSARALLEPEVCASSFESATVQLSDYAAAGFYLSRPTGTEECAGINLARRSLASDPSERAFFPDDWTLSWVRRDAAERAARAAVFGFGADQVDSIKEWAKRSFGVSFGLWRVIFSLDDARTIGQSALGACDGVELWGVGLHRSLVDAYCRDAARLSASGVCTAVRARGKLPEGGTILGHEVLFEELGASFSNPESRNLDEVAMFRKTGVAPNDDGLIDSFKDAKKCCRYLDEQAATSNVKGWQPWLLVRYPLF
jgi:hypothetical protein